MSDDRQKWLPSRRHDDTPGHDALDALRPILAACLCVLVFCVLVAIIAAAAISYDTTPTYEVTPTGTTTP